MKKHITLIIFIIAATSVYADSNLSKLEDNLHIKFTHVKSINKDDYSPSSISAVYNNALIRYFKKEFKNFKSDAEGLYSSSELKDFYNEIQETNTSHGLEKGAAYGFGEGTIIQKTKDGIFVDYIVDSLFEISDVRLERVLLLFTKKDVTVIQITPADKLSQYQEQLKKHKYIVHLDGDPNGEMHWDVKMRDKFISELRNGTLQIKKINDWHKTCEEIKAIVE